MGGEGREMLGLVLVGAKGVGVVSFNIGEEMGKDGVVALNGR